MKVRITGNHKHRGKPVPVGEVLDLPPQVGRLVVNVWQTGEEVSSVRKSKSKSKSEESV